MKILITTYHQAFLVRGGGEYEMFTVAESLKRKGLIVDIYSPYSRSIDNYDVILHFSVHGGGIELLNEISKTGKPVVLWPNLWVNEVDAALINLVNAHVELSRAVVFKSKTEYNHFNSLFRLPRRKVFFTVFGADPSYLKPSPEGLFRSLLGLDQYAIWFGVIEPNKNQLAAIRVLRKKNIPLVLVGRYRDKHYYDMCKATAAENVLFIEGLPQRSEIARSALREALFYIEVSHEPPGLSAIEAGLSGCRLLLSDSEWSREHFEDSAIYADSHSDDAIASAVDEVLIRPHESGKLVDMLKKHCLPESIDSLVEILRSVAN